MEVTPESREKAKVNKIETNPTDDDNRECNNTFNDEPCVEDEEWDDAGKLLPPHTKHWGEKYFFLILVYDKMPKSS